MKDHAFILYEKVSLLNLALKPTQVFKGGRGKCYSSLHQFFFQLRKKQNHTTKNLNQPQKQTNKKPSSSSLNVASLFLHQQTRRKELFHGIAFTQVQKRISVIINIVSFLHHTKVLNINVSEEIFEINLQQYCHIHLQSYMTTRKNTTQQGKPEGMNSQPEVSRGDDTALFPETRDEARKLPFYKQLNWKKQEHLNPCINAK